MNATLKGPYGRCRKCNVVWAMEGRPLKAKQQTQRGGAYAGREPRRCPDCKTAALYQTALALMTCPVVKPWQDRAGEARR